MPTKHGARWWGARCAGLAAALGVVLAHGSEALATHTAGNIGGYATTCGHLTTPGPSPGFTPTVSGLPDIVQISPNIMILLDTSGSMEYMAVDGDTPTCNAGSPGLTNEKNRWWQIVEALTGTIPGFSCGAENRSSPGGRIDAGYFLNHYVGYTTGVQANDGLLDTYNGLLKFGLFTFDSYNSTSTGSSGMWSYGPNVSWGGNTYNVGARGPSAERGARISVGREDLVNVATINTMVQNEILCSIPYWGTPTAAQLTDVAWYFANHSDVSAAGDPYYSCRERAVVLVSDGAPSTGECSYYPCSETAAASLLTSGIDTFVVGMNITDAGAITKLDDIAAAGGTTGAYFTTDLASFRTAMNGVLGALADRITSRSIPAVAPAPLSTGSLQLEFSAAVEVEGGPWKGRLERTRFDCNIDPDPLTLESEHTPAIDDFAARLQTQVVRNLFTVSPDTAAVKTTFDTSIPLAWVGAASATERDNIVNYVLGTYLRPTKLGDIINSAPVMISVPSLDLPMESYRLFKEHFQTTPRTLMLFTGTNDGIVHAFDAESETAAEPVELWGFVPPLVLDRLKTSLAGHAFLVDGPNQVMDVILRRDLSTTLPGTISDPRDTGWYTVLLASLGNGGRAVYGLDVTTPDVYSSVVQLFEFAYDLPDGTDGDTLRDACDMSVSARKCDDDLGYTVGQPAMGRMVVLESGVAKELGVAMIPAGNPPTPSTATAGRAMYVVALEDGHLIKKYDDTTKCSGETALFDSPIVGDVGAHSDGPGAFVTRFFAGDLAGRLWRFDTSSSDPTDWCQMVFTPAAYRNGEAIYDAPALALNEDAELVVVYGTGDITNILVQTPDNLVISLTEKIAFDPSTGDVTGITSETNWVRYLDVGEKTTGSPVVFDGCAYFATFLPDGASPCDVGNARLWGLDFVGDDPTVGVVNDLVACFDPDPLDPADTPVEYLDLAAGSLTAGVSLVRRPACVETDTIPDPTPGAVLGATVERITALTPATYVISAHIGNVGSASTAPGTVPKIERAVAPPSTKAFLVSWAEIFD